MNISSDDEPRPTRDRNFFHILLSSEGDRENAVRNKVKRPMCFPLK